MLKGLKSISALLLCCAISGGTVYATPSERQVSQASQQQDGTCTGVVVDETGMTVIGASVVVKGTTNGAITDLDGKFTIKSAKPGDVIVITYVGYSPVEVTWNGQPLNVTLKEDSELLEEVVVVGYGVQKKVNVTGAVSMVESDVLENRPVANVSQALQGQIPGLNLGIGTGGGALDGTMTINIRGAGTISTGSSASPLVLIDGLEGDMNALNPDDIENISVLKDASSSSIYGARAAFGVILITTKSGAAGKPKVNYSGNVRFNDPIGLPTVSNSYDFATAFNAAKVNDGGGVMFQPDYMQRIQDFMSGKITATTIPNGTNWAKWNEGSNDNINWIDEFYGRWAPSHEHNLSVSGGSDRAKYYVSGRYFNQDGIYSAGGERYTQYNLNSRGEIRINRNLTLENSTKFTHFKSHQPMVMYDRQNIARQIQHQGYPVTMEKNPDGTWTEAAVYIGWAGFVEGTSWQKNGKIDFRNTSTLTWEPILDQLTFKGDFTYAKSLSDRRRAENQYEYYTGPEIVKERNTYSSLENVDYDKEYISSNITGNYEPQFANPDHYLNVLLGWNLETQSYETITTYRRGLLYPTKPSFALMDGDYYTENQSGYEWAYVGFLYRVNYNYKNRYLAEFSGRYDGSSKFPSNQQWGFFPSGSVGWRISEEPFMAPARTWLDNLKLRASIGSLGNGSVDPYLYLSTVPIKRTSVILDGGLQGYATTPGIVPSSLTWERATTYDVGLDFALLNNRLSATFDYYQRYTTDMYTVGPTLPAVLGASTPKGNNAEMKTRGWELSVEWRDRFTLGDKPFNYSIKAMVWDNRTWVTKFYNPTKSLSTYYEGQEIGTIWGYHIEGLFKDQAEIDAHADQSYLVVSDDNILKPGDLKFADLDGSGAVDNGKNTLDDHGDLKVVGNTTPRYQFGVTLAANWNGFGVSAFFQGVGKRDLYLPNSFRWQYGSQWQVPTAYANDYWTESNRDAYFPVARFNGGTALGQNQTRYLLDGSYLRLKSLSFGYTLPETLTQKAYIQKARIYFTAENLFTIKHTPEGFDPELDNPYAYPQQRALSIGVNLTF